MKTDYPLDAMIEESAAVLMNMLLYADDPRIVRQSMSFAQRQNDYWSSSVFMLCNGSPLSRVVQLLLGAMSALKLDFDRKELPNLWSRTRAD